VHELHIKLHGTQNQGLEEERLSSIVKAIERLFSFTNIHTKGN
jgi:hypothetical protein